MIRSIVADQPGPFTPVPLQYRGGGSGDTLVDIPVDE